MKIFLKDSLKICPSISDPSRRKSVEPEKGSFRNQNQRTRSASRERNLVKIKFCWRCHQTGHESFDCTAELQPANWCPRCLESSHWEDSCWVNEQEVSKEENILKGSIVSIPSPSHSVKIKMMGGKVCLRCKCKILLDVVNKLLKTKGNVLPYYLK